MNDLIDCEAPENPRRVFFLYPVFQPVLIIMNDRDHENENGNGNIPQIGKKNEEIRNFDSFKIEVPSPI